MRYHYNFNYPAITTLRPLDLLRVGTSEWKRTFPFSAENGLWTFSGRSALYQGLKRIRLRAGTTILVPAYFQGSEIDTLLHAGYKLQFYRLQENFQVNLNDIEDRLLDDVTALYIIHYFGIPQPVHEISEFCKAREIALIEDCALGLFSRASDIWLGSVGDMSLFSVHKTVPVPHGGFLVTKEGLCEEQLKRPPLESTVFQMANLVVQYVKASSSYKLVEWVKGVTSNHRKALVARTVLSGDVKFDPTTLELSASHLVRGLMRLFEPKEIIRRRRENFRRLSFLLRNVIESPVADLPRGACPLMYPVMVRNKEEFQRELATRGVDSVNLWCQTHPACPKDLSDEVMKWRRQIVELPVHQQLELEHIERMAETVRAVVEGRSVKEYEPKDVIVRDPVPLL